MITFGISLLSGGLDSTTVTAYAKNKCENLIALTFHYGQSHFKEAFCAQQVAKIMGVKHKIIDISSFGSVAWYSALTNPESYQIPQCSLGQNTESTVPITYVPLRNTIFLSLSAAYLESQILHAIEVEKFYAEEINAVIYTAPNAIDYSGYPDCRPEYFDQVCKTLNQGSKLGTQYQIPIKVQTPIIHLSKRNIVEMGIELQSPLYYTWSCYTGNDIPCGKCASCLLRSKGFQEAGVPDPLLERLGVGSNVEGK